MENFSAEGNVKWIKVQTIILTAWNSTDDTCIWFVISSSET